MTHLTIIDQLLVLLDDEQSHSLTELTTLPNRTKQTVSSTLGRLLTKGWVARQTGRGQRGQYRITADGRAHVTHTLDQVKLRTAETWDQSWEQIVFNIPERDRKRRDDLRALLVDLGYGRLHGWLWLSPWSHRAQIEAYMHRTRSEHDITILRTGPLDQVTNQRIGRLFEWDWKTLEAAYQEMIAEARSFLRQSPKRSYDARCIVYQYAKVLATDPKLPTELPAHVSSAATAYELYQKVRPFCYQD